MYQRFVKLLVPLREAAENDSHRRRVRTRDIPLCGKQNSLQKRHCNIDHQLLFLWLGLGDHHRQCDERMVGDALRAVLAEKKLVTLQKIEHSSYDSSTERPFAFGLAIV